MAKCPYDGFECEKLAEGFEKWRRAVNFMSANTTKLVFVTSLTMLNKCNDVTNCARYIRWIQEQSQQKQK